MLIRIITTRRWTKEISASYYYFRRLMSDNATFSADQNAPLFDTKNFFKKSEKLFRQFDLLMVIVKEVIWGVCSARSSVLLNAILACGLSDTFLAPASLASLWRTLLSLSLSLGRLDLLTSPQEETIPRNVGYELRYPVRLLNIRDFSNIQCFDNWTPDETIAILYPASNNSKELL